MSGTAKTRSPGRTPRTGSTNGPAAIATANAADESVRTAFMRAKESPPCLGTRPCSRKLDHCAQTGGERADHKGDVVPAQVPFLRVGAQGRVVHDAGPPLRALRVPARVRRRRNAPREQGEARTVACGRGSRDRAR